VQRDTERPARGFASLVAIGAVFLITGLVAAWAGPYRYRVRDEEELRSRWEARAALEAEASSILRDLADSTRGRTEDMLAYRLPPSARLEDQGARINLNWARSFVLADSPFLLSLFTGGSPASLQAFRRKARLGTRVEAYSGFFDRESLDLYFTARSPLNVNAVDEFAFENAMAQATGSASSGASWRERLRALRQSNTLVRSEGELRSWFGADWDEVSPFVAASPEWNANTLAPVLLGAVLACSDFALADSASAASAIVEARERHYLGDSELRTILGLAQDHPIWAHLGTESAAWTLSVSNASGARIEVDFARRGETEPGGAFRLTARRWSHA
jgi:type II secretory pathway component PulK